MKIWSTIAKSADPLTSELLVFSSTDSMIISKITELININNDVMLLRGF